MEETTLTVKLEAVYCGVTDSAARPPAETSKEQSLIETEPTASVVRAKPFICVKVLPASCRLSAAATNTPALALPWNWLREAVMAVPPVMEMERWAAGVTLCSCQLLKVRLAAPELLKSKAPNLLEIEEKITLSALKMVGEVPVLMSTRKAALKLE